MLSLPRRAIKRIAENLGYEIKPLQQYGTSPVADMRRLLQLAGRNDGEVIFDVGANVGVTVREFRKAFPRSVIHAFEPSARTFEQLKANTSMLAGVTLNNMGVGSSEGTQLFHESHESTMSSFLQPDRDCFAGMAGDSTVLLGTIDSYCERKGISTIDILKSDTQGYEMEVLRGAERMLSRGAIRLVYMEIIFSAMYQGLPGFDQLFRYLLDNNFHLVTFYRTEVRDNRAGWTDALFAFNGSGSSKA